MPHGIPLGEPDRYVADNVYFTSVSRLPPDLVMVCRELLRHDIGVHHRPKRNRYTIDGKPIARRTIDRLVYFGVIDESELQNG